MRFIYALLFVPLLNIDQIDANTLTIGQLILGSGIAGTAAESVAVDSMPFAVATRVTIPSAGEQPWDAQATSKIEDSLQEQEALLVTFYVRSATAQQGRVGFRFEKLSSPWTGAGDLNVAVGPTWKKIVLPLRVPVPEGQTGYGPSEAGLRFRLGFLAQTIDIGGVCVEIFGNASLDSLQLVAAKQRDTTWREDARRRIETHRKGDFSLLVHDAAGNPVPRLAVTVSMRRHAFTFGGLMEDLILQTGTDAEMFRKHTAELFNGVTQRIYWPWNWNSPTNIEKVFRLIEWADSVGLESRGHTIVYPTWQYSPPFLQNYQSDPVALNDTIQGHIAACASALRGRLTDYDVVNEAYHFSEVIEAAGGYDRLADWYTLAKQTAPDIGCYVNEFGIISNGGDLTAQQGYKNLINLLLDKRAPVDGIGIQGHTNQYTPPEDLYAVLDDFAQFGLPIRVTEMDVNVENETVQAMNLYDYMLIIFSHPATVGLTLWGFWEGNMWQERKGLVRKDWTMKPSGEVWKDLTTRTWWTDDRQGTTNSSGLFTFPGFKGSYTVRITDGDIDTTVTVRLHDSVDTATIQLGGTAAVIGHTVHGSTGAVSWQVTTRSCGMAVRLSRDLAHPGRISLIDYRGRVVQTRQVAAGEQNILLPGRFSTGMYLLRLRNMELHLIKRVLVHP